METSLILCAVVIITCILTNKLTNRIGVPAVLVFMAIGMIFGSEGIFKIPFDNFGIAEKICSTALVFIMFYGGFGTSLKAAKPVLKPINLHVNIGCCINIGIDRYILSLRITYVS